MRRPIGLILSAITLSLAALFLLLMTALMAIATSVAEHQSPIAASQHLVFYFALAYSVFTGVLAVWAILTVIGILRLRSWARYSILIIGGGLAVTSILGALGTLFSRTMVPTIAAQQPGVDPRFLSIAFMVIAAIELLIAAVGVWWLVYFNLRSTCDLFRPPVPTLPYHTPLPPEAPGATSIPNLPANPSSGLFSSPPHAPAAIKIIAWFLLIGAVLCLPLVFLPIPAFILSFIVPVKASHFLFLTILFIAAGTGYGLLKLTNFARLATIAFIAFGLINSAISLLPWSQNRLREYLAQFTAHFTAMLPTFPGQPTPVYNYPISTIVFNSLVGIAINIYVLWLLHRHRTAFNPPPPVSN